VTTEESSRMMARIDGLERRLRLLGVLSAVLVIVAMSAITVPSVTAQAQPQVLRARGLIIVDEQGRERIVIGSPVPDPKEGKRLNPSTGMVINDINGYERFGLGLTQDNRMGMGFDAPPGKGDDRNRERINIVADENGREPIFDSSTERQGLWVASFSMLKISSI
jgi:hypothetical protein